MQDGLRMRNEAIKCPYTWEEDGVNFHELIRQEYDGNSCIIRGGFVEGENKPSVDTIFLRLEKEGVEPTTLLLRPDEMQAIAWIASGTVWSHLMGLKPSD